MAGLRSSRSRKRGRERGGLSLAHKTQLHLRSSGSPALPTLDCVIVWLMPRVCDCSVCVCVWVHDHPTLHLRHHHLATKCCRYFTSNSIWRAAASSLAAGVSAPRLLAPRSKSLNLFLKSSEAYFTPTPPHVRHNSTHATHSTVPPFSAALQQASVRPCVCVCV